MEEILAMSTKEIDRFTILKQVLEKKLTQIGASKLLGISDRQVRNLLSAVKSKGAEGVISRRRGQPGNNRKPQALKERALVLVKTKYLDFGPTFASEKLEELDGVKICPETLRRWMIEAKMWILKQKKRKTHPPRARRTCFGELIQVDGSHHRWFGPDGPMVTLLVFIDDATSKVTALYFCKQETLDDYFSTLEKHLKQYGIPRGIYSDKLRVFEGGKHLSHFQQALASLQIESILAESPQAKGRVERVNRTLQDRFLKELSLRGITTIEEANKYAVKYLKAHNTKFSIEPVSDVDAHRPLEKDHDLDRLLCRREERTLSKDFVFQFHNRFYKINEIPEIRRPKGRKVEVRLTRAGKLMVFLGDKKLGVRALDEIVEKSPTMTRNEVLSWNPRRQRCVRNDHPWKQAYMREKIRKGQLAGFV